MITKNIKNIFAAGLVGCVVSLGLTACTGDKDAPIPDLTPAKCPSSIAFNLPDQLQQLIYVDETGSEVLPLIKGETAQLTYTMEPEDITYNSVLWTSSNPDIVSVDDAGNITALSGDGLGYSIVSLAPVGMFSGSGVNCTLKVKVANSIVPAESVTVNISDTEVYAGETLQASASILPEDATYRTVKWSSSNEAAATVDINGVVTGQVTSNISTPVTIIATTLDGSDIVGSVDIIVKQIVQPQSITLDQSFAAPNYYCAIGEKSVTLSYTTVPADCTRSLIEWSSSDETIATVQDGVVTFNQSGNFGDFTITARCPETGNESSVKMSLPAGLIRELYHNPDNITWRDNNQSGNGTKTSTEWHDGYITVTTYTVNATTQRADIQCHARPVWVHAGNYPIFAIRMDDVKDKYTEITSRNINFDAVGQSESGVDYKAIANGNNKYLHDYKCSDGSHVFVYDFATQACGTGGLMPTTETVKFNTFQLKYADFKTIDHQVTFNIYWVQTFKTLDDVLKYVTSEGLTYEQIK